MWKIVFSESPSMKNAYRIPGSTKAQTKLNLNHGILNIMINK